MDFFVPRDCVPIAYLKKMSQAFAVDSKLQSFVLLYGPEGSGKKAVATHISKSVFGVREVQVYKASDLLDTTFSLASPTTGEHKSITEKMHYIFNQGQASKTESLTLVIEECDLLFTSPCKKEIADLIVKKLYDAEQRSQGCKLSVIFITAKPCTIPHCLSDMLDTAIFVPMPTQEERKAFFTKTLLCLHPSTNNSTFTQANNNNADIMMNCLAMTCSSTSYERMTRFVQRIVGRANANLLGESKSLDLEAILDLAHSFFPKKTGPVDMSEFVQFRKAFNFNIPCASQELDGSPEYQRPYAKKKTSTGQWVVKVKKWYFEWLPVAQCTISEEELSILRDEGDALFLDDLDNTVMTAAPIESPFFETPSKPSVNGIVTPKMPASWSPKESVAIKLFSTPKKRARVEYMDVDESEDDVDDVDFVPHKSANKKPRRTSKSPFTPPSRANLQASPTSSSPKSAPQPEDAKEDDDDDSKKTPRGKKWYKTYNGALAYAIFKAKSWCVKNDGKMDVRVDSDKKKFGMNCSLFYIIIEGGSIYDWDIIWLGLKLIPTEVKDFTSGINSARRFIKNHDTVSPYLQEWRKNRSTLDKDLKTIFHVTSVTSDAALEAFLNVNRCWPLEDEEKVLLECKSRAGLITDDDTEQDVTMTNVVAAPSFLERLDMK